MEKGKFVISLDFELHWGAAELWDLNLMKPYFDAARQSIPDVLALFEKYNIHATWATVGFLFAKNKEQLLAFSPKDFPTYTNKKLSAYHVIENGEIGFDESDDPYHYAPSLIRKIVDTPNQELGTHTFSHYYCNEPGQNEQQFDADLKAAQAISKENFGIQLQSLVLPRNQFNPTYLKIAEKNGIKVVRSNPDVWFWKNDFRFSPLARAFDTLFPISGTLSYKHKERTSKTLTLHPASRFLRPYSPKERFIQKLKISRIKSEMTYAAKRNRVYHLWWHPHNFGNATQNNVIALDEILRHYKQLHIKYNFTSASMIELY